MSPMWQMHGYFQNRVARKLEEVLPDGVVVTESAIRTRDGTRVADVAWFTREHWEQARHEFDATKAPLICIEILPSSNTKEEMAEKMKLYSAAGAQEFWTVDSEGGVRFFVDGSEQRASGLAPEFPARIEP
ncbi:MAG: Uma2 family endonuclease [Spirochaetales bacterium]|nr:Uma2 family endonuclease [Spirochaetales bacterium]